MSDLTQTGQVLLLSLINTANPSLPNGPLSADNVTFSAPSAATGGDRDTQVTITGVSGHGYMGTDVIDYDRLDVQSLADAVTGTAGSPLSIVQTTSPTPTDVFGLIDDLNTASSPHGFSFDQTDLTNQSVDLSTLPVTLTLLTASASLKYTGTLSVQVVAPA